MALRCIILGLCVVSSLAVPTPSGIDATLNWRVVGGRPAPKGSYPYVVSLLNRGHHHCGGSIVSKNYVITAAHCVDRIPEEYWTIKAGINNLADPGHVYKVLKINQHEHYDQWNLFNDVAILEVEEIDLSLPKISTIRAETDFVDGSEPVALAGWGSAGPGSLVSEDLQHILLATISVRDCQIGHGIPLIRDTQICTLTKFGEGACLGDIGSPLIRRVDDHERLVGIISWGTHCAQGEPDVSSRVSSYVSWFNDKCNNCLN